LSTTATIAAETDVATGAPAGRAAPNLSVSDLAELIASFNDVTARLQSTHESLRGEVSRLESELRDAKDQLHRAQELAALGEMAAGIAHEVRNPLGSIRLYASALVSDLRDRPSEQDLARKIAGAVTRLDAVVGDVLAFSRRMVVRPEALCASRLIDEAVDACRGVLERHGVSVHRARPKKDVEFRGDAVLLHQALVNVVRNAAEAIADDECRPAGIEPAIWIEARRTRRVDAAGQAQDVTSISVRDSGPGIPPEVLSRVFNPFFTTRAAGTGLGLAIVHRIIDAHGGRVVIKSHSQNQSSAQSSEVAGSDEPASRSGVRASPAGRSLARGTTVEFLLPMSGAMALPDDGAQHHEAASSCTRSWSSMTRTCSATASA
jgi:signal transduction histidine kinase